MSRYKGKKADVLLIQEELRIAFDLPCCECHLVPSADCQCREHRRLDGSILPGPHDGLSVATQAVGVFETPDKTRLFIDVDEHLLSAKEKKNLEEIEDAKTES